MVKIKHSLSIILSKKVVSVVEFGSSPIDLDDEIAKYLIVNVHKFSADSDSPTLQKFKLNLILAINSTSESFQTCLKEAHPNVVFYDPDKVPSNDNELRHPSFFGTIKYKQLEGGNGPIFYNVQKLGRTPELIVKDYEDIQKNANKSSRLGPFQCSINWKHAFIHELCHAIERDLTPKLSASNRPGIYSSEDLHSNSFDLLLINLSENIRTTFSNNFPELDKKTAYKNQFPTATAAMVESKYCAYFERLLIKQRPDDYLKSEICKCISTYASTNYMELTAELLTKVAILDSQDEKEDLKRFIDTISGSLLVSIPQLPLLIESISPGLEKIDELIQHQNFQKK